MSDDYRQHVRADTEQTRRMHQPGIDDRCGNCLEPYPCGPVRLADLALDALDRRRARPRMPPRTQNAGTDPGQHDGSHVE